VAALALIATRPKPAGPTKVPEALRSASAFGPSLANPAPPPGPAPQGMVWVPGGEFSMGSDDPRSSMLPKSE
jgi:sulfatase modifying factor 1